jgi:hypothetical protein
MNRMFRKCSTLALLIALTGCSVGMAMSGKPDPNLGAFGVGSSRGQVEMHIGSPTTSTTLPDGTRMDLYSYEIGNTPSPGRAIGHGVMDVLTLGLWEVIGTPIEAWTGQTHSLAVTYDASDRVIVLTRGSPPQM